MGSTMNRSISNREQLAFALIFEGNVGQKDGGHQIVSVSLFTVPKHKLFKPLFNYTNQMHNIYPLCTFTVSLLQVLVLHSPSSGRTYMPFTENHMPLCTRIHKTENFKTSCSVHKIQKFCVSYLTFS